MLTHPQERTESTHSETANQAQFRVTAPGTTQCLLCKGSLQEVVSGLRDTRFGTTGTYSIVQCVDCGVEQTMPLPSVDELKALYEQHYNFGGERDTVYTSWREWFLFSGLYKWWLKIDGDPFFHGRKGNNRLLDIGCNEGRSLHLLSRNGFQVEGLELNQKAAAVARARGFKVYTARIEDFMPVNAYDVVVLSNVLEHSLDPKRMLIAAASCLKSQGEIWLSCPNSRSWLRKLCGREWINWHVPFHITHFSSPRLVALLEEVGFTEVRIRHITPSLWVASSAVSKLFARPERMTGELRNPGLLFTFMLLSRFLLFPLLWIGNSFNRGDCLVVTATKL